MADRIKGIVVEIGGDTTGLSKALSGVNKEISNTQSQLRDVEKLLKLDPKNTELLAQKQKLLKDAIGETKTKLDTLHKAEQQLKDNGVDQNSEQFMALEREIIATDQQMATLTKSAEETNKAIKETGDTSKEAKGNVIDLGGALETAGKAFATVAAAAVAATAAVATSLAKMTKEGAAYADTVLTESTITGIATDKLQEYMYAAELVDVSTETLTGSMTKNIRTMSAAQEGTASAVEAYEKLGISVTNADGTLRDGETVYWEVIDALGKVQNETERDAIAMDILGRSARDLNPLIEAGSARMEELGKAARESGYVLSDEALNSYGAFDDQLQYLSKNVDAAKNALGTVLLPVLTTLATDGNELITQFTSGIAEANGDIGKIGDTIGATLGSLVDKIFEALPEIMSLAGSIVSTLANKILDNLPMMIDAALSLILTLADGLVKALPTMMPAIVEVITGIVEKLTEPEMIVSLVEAALTLALAIAAGLIKALPKIIASVDKVIKNIASAVVELGADVWSGLVDGAVKAWDAIKTVFGKVGSFFSDTFKKAWEGIVKIFSSAGSIFKDIKDAIVSAFKNIVNSLIKGINKVVAKPFEGINAMIEKLKSIKILGLEPFANLKGISIPEIPMLARGGVVSSGSAIVGEAGPELLTVANGKTIVQPLTTNNHSFSAPFTINVYGSEGQNVNELADVVAERIQKYIARKESAF